MPAESGSGEGPRPGSWPPPSGCALTGGKLSGVSPTRAPILFVGAPHPPPAFFPKAHFLAPTRQGVGFNVGSLGDTDAFPAVTGLKVGDA